MSQTRTIRSTGHPIADKVLEGTAPDPVRLAAARGALPVSREVMLGVLVFLLDDANPSIRDTATKTLEGMPSAELAQHLANPEVDPAVLDWFGTRGTLSPEAFAALMTNPMLQDATLESIATSGSTAAIDMLLLNQVRLAKCPGAIDALTVNESLNTDQRRRLLDFIEHMESPAAPAPAEAERGLDPELLGPVSDEELRAMLGQMRDLSFIELEVGEFLSSESVIQGIEELGEQGTSFESVFKQILGMSPPQKLRAALRSGREARQILIRDTNRMIAAAVLRNPRLTEEEVVNYAAQKTLHEEVFRLIGGSRAWMSSYAVMHNMVRNPKTPVAVAMNNIGRLHTKELTNIHRDKNIPEVIRRMAKRVLESRAAKTIKFKRH